MTNTATTTELSEQEATDFRQRCVDFLEEHATGAQGRGAIGSSKEFLAAAAEAGLGGIPYPTEYGGGGLTLAHDKIWREAKANYRQMEFDFIISHGMCLPMLNEYGTHEQKAEFLADNIAGRTMWCQMFSEPSSGSDVASLQTKAELDGDQWVINGQKVWTTLAHVSANAATAGKCHDRELGHRSRCRRLRRWLLALNGLGTPVWLGSLELIRKISSSSCEAGQLDAGAPLPEV